MSARTTADVVIGGGLLIDGTGAPARRADVAITGGRVTEIGTGLRGRDELDASGHVVAPGFIDIHTHYDAQVFWDPALTPSCYHGVTTVVAGNCGFSLAPTRERHRDAVIKILETVEDMNPASLTEGIPWDFETFPQYLDAVARRPLVLNFAAYIGHTPLRLYVMGDDFDRAATPSELDAMKRLLHEAMVAGAAGFATSFGVLHQDSSGKPVPSRFADVHEMEALFGVLRDLGAGVVTVNPGGPCTYDALYELQPKFGVPFTYGALLSEPDGSHVRRVEMNDDAWANGVKVWPQVTPRPVTVEFTMAQTSSLLAANPVFNELTGRPLDARRAAFADAAFRSRLGAAFDVQRRLVPRWETYTVLASRNHPALAGRHLVDIAAERGVAPFEALLDLALEDGDLSTQIRGIVSNDDPEAVAALLVDEHCTLGLSDAGAHLAQLCDAAQATELLGLWVRDRAVMPIEQAVRKLSCVQADLMGFTDRGRLRPGTWADVVVFDPDTIGPGPVRKVHDFPGGAARLTADQPVGIAHVLVNGTPIRRDGEGVQGASAGQVVRPAPAA
ncbi:MAG TPA: amidohydrolase family protein [Acidimicrobiales bacterium]|nr:amidohydrolase family protein [Acidimicrobiales bacterium]